MADEGWLLSKKAELLEIECRMQGMVADNAFRKHIGSEPAHTGIDFSIVGDQAKNIADDIMKNR